MIKKYTFEIILLLSSLFRRLNKVTLTLEAYHWQIPLPFLFQPKQCCSLMDPLQSCEFNHDSRRICLFSFLLIQKYLDQPVKFRNVPFLFYDCCELRLTLEAECLSKNLELSLTRLWSHNAVNLVILGIQNEEIPLVNWAKDNHLVDITLHPRLVKFLSEMFSYLNRNVCKWNTQGQ